MKIYLMNAFSLQMLDFPAKAVFEEIAVHGTPSQAIAELSEKIKQHGDELVSVIGHKDTADLLGVPFNRVSVRLEPDSIAYVVQFVGGRLPEGCTVLPENCKLKIIKVRIER